MTVTISSAHNEARLSGTLSFIDAGPAAPLVQLYDGPRPATPTTAVTAENHLIAAIALTQPAGTVAAGVLTLTPEADGLILLTGSPTWARLLNGNGAAVFDCDVGVGVGAWEIKIAQAELFAGGDAKITSFAVT